MRLEGTLKTWNDDRGFGFIAPKDGGRDVFVHVSAFPRDGTRPKAGEVLFYEFGTGRGDKPRAINVSRQRIAQVTRKTPRVRRPSSLGSFLSTALSLVAFAFIVAYGFSSFQRLRLQHSGDQVITPLSAADLSKQTYRCDGRTHCSQMASCEEAKFFLQHCPNSEMDGNHDGVPCEKQWCTGLFGN